MYSYYRVKGLYNGWEWKKGVIEHNYFTIVDWLKRLELESYILSISDMEKVFKVENNEKSQMLFKKTGFFKEHDFKVKKIRKRAIKKIDANEDWNIIYHPLVEES